MNTEPMPPDDREDDDDDCDDVAAEHAAMLAGDEIAKQWHDPEECEACLEARPPIENICRCAECCRRLIIEVSLRDAEREPKIKELGSPIYQDARLTASGKQELIGYMLNKVSPGSYACVFLEEATNLCQIHPTRPLICRLFDCEGKGREQLIELGILRRDEEPRP